MCDLGGGAEWLVLAVVILLLGGTLGVSYYSVSSDVARRAAVRASCLPAEELVGRPGGEWACARIRVETVR